MGTFLKKVFVFFAFFAALLVIVLSYQLYYINKVWQIIPEQQPVLLRDMDERHNATQINILGCSNLNHDIDMEEIRTKYPTVNVNKYAFSGSLNTCYMKYLVGCIKASGNNAKYITFLPTNHYFRQNTFPHEPYFYEFGICRGFLSFLFRENPMVLLSENWRGVYNKTKPFHFEAYNTVFREGKHIMDSLANNKTMYSECNYPFNRNKHEVKAPTVGEQDAAYFNDIFGKENYAMINAPVPNIPQHMHFNYSVFEKAGFNKPLDPVDSVIRDSSLFYDQWYHMNKCGRTIETDKFIREMRQLHLDK